METDNINTNLLSLVLALQDLEEALTEKEAAAIAKAAKQLSVKPEAWSKKIKPNLLATIEKNSSLSKQFQFYQSQLERIDGEITDDLLPTAADLEPIEKTPQMAKSRAPLQVSGKDTKGREITNMALEIMVSNSPKETANKINYLEKIKQFLINNSK